MTFIEMYLMVSAIFIVILIVECYAFVGLIVIAINEKKIMSKYDEKPVGWKWALMMVWEIWRWPLTLIECVFKVDFFGNYKNK